MGDFVPGLCLTVYTAHFFYLQKASLTLYDDSSRVKKVHSRKDRPFKDPDYLDMLNTMLYAKGEVFAIPENMKEGIRQGTADIKNGDIHTLADFERKYREWLKE